MTFFRLCFLLAVGGLPFVSTVDADEWSGLVGIEGRYFTQTPQDPRQFDHENVSLIVEPEYIHEWDDGRQVFAFVPFFRIDQHDSNRTHFDIRELTWEKAEDAWELRLGVRKVFWGVAEFQHLVDIINQTDLVENLDTEDKLGQPMANLALIQDWGTLDVFVLPFFRERTFAGSEGRPREQPPVDEDQAGFESSAEEHHVDFAIRYSHFIGDWDIGLAHFYGTSRAPRLIPGVDASGSAVLIPFYDIINQTSLDVQATKGNMLWKLEALHRSGQANAFNALAGGFEYTFVGIFETVIDLGILGEYHYDDRGESAPTTLEDDIALGTRLSFNDVQSTEALMGLIVDRESSGKFFNLEASRRLGENWVVEFQVRAFFGQSRTDPAFTFTRDDYAEMAFFYYF